MSVVRLRQVYLPTDDAGALAAFLGGVLGLELQFRDEDRWVQFRAGDVSLAVASRAEANGAEHPVPVLEVTGLDALLAQASAAGAIAGEVRDMGDHGRTVLLTLPGGTAVALLERAEAG